MSGTDQGEATERVAMRPQTVTETGMMAVPPQACRGSGGIKLLQEPCKSLRRHEDSVTEASAGTLLLLLGYAIALVLP